MNRELACVGGAITDFIVPEVDRSRKEWQITAVGRATGVVTIWVKAYKGDAWEPVYGKTTLDLSVNRTMRITGMVDGIRMDDTGNVGNFTMSLTCM